MREIPFNNLNTEDLNVFFINTIGSLPYETLCVALLDKEHNVKAIIELESGSGNNVTNDLSDVFRCAVSYSCKRIVLCHNHPDGRVAPSDFDIIATKRAIKLLENNGIYLIEHIIVTDSEYSLLIKDYLTTL
ncbi:MAG: hypothetical protein J6A85_06140 [Clostridia bacterium]|nr:hypothetical protein [Clostridia bacterium]